MSAAAGFTPTTSTVRMLYARSGGTGPAHPSTGRRAAEFDRWIAQHDAEVADKALDGARKELQAAYKAGPGARLDGMPATWRKGVSRAHRIVRDYQHSLRGGAS